MCIRDRVILTLKEEYSHLASNNLLNRVLSRYCILLHEPVFVGDADVYKRQAASGFQMPFQNFTVSLISGFSGKP